MSDLLTALDGERLSRDDFIRDYEDRVLGIGEAGFWKFERRQNFQERNNTSWDAFVGGDWNKVIQLLNERNDDLRAYVERHTARGIPLNRVRVVEEPISPYLLWELRSLRQRAECGEHIRVIRPDRIAGHENETELPEIVVLGKEAVYQVLYTEDALADGAIRSLDSRTVTRLREFIVSLHASAENVISFFHREVAPLLPPVAR